MTAILIVDDEPAIRESLAFALQREGFAIAEAGTLKEAKARAAAADLILLDLVLPDGNGLEFLRALRAKSDVPVIVLTSRDEETDRVVGLEMGADDYVLKPFSPREVAARVRAVLRRSVAKAPPPEEEKPLQSGSLSADLRSRKALAGERELAYVAAVDLRERGIVSVAGTASIDRPILHDLIGFRLRARGGNKQRQRHREKGESKSHPGRIIPQARVGPVQ